jgi:DNA-binding response OmpR family regulator
MAKDSPEPPLRRVLLVEDDLDQAHLVKFLLEAEGCYVVTLVQDGVRGTSLVQSEVWDLVITDLNLPGQNGVAVAVASRRHQPGTPILAATSQARADPHWKAFEGSADDLIVKPFSKDELLSKVAELITRGPRPRVAPAKSDADPTPEGGLLRLRVLAVSVRPGDAEAGCGATLLLHRERGDRVTLLTLTRGVEATEGRRRAESAKAAGRAMDVRYFVGNAGSAEIPLEEDLRRICRDALREVRPELIYLPTKNHAFSPIRIVHETIAGEAVGAHSILAYTPGDATASFRPTFFVPVGSRIARKGEALAQFELAHGDHLTPDFSSVSARFWAARTGGEPAEPFEVVRGDPPAGLG